MYKVGDKVLVEAEIAYVCESANYWLIFSHAASGEKHLFADNAIHSLAPEFKHQEKVEFRYSVGEDWRTGAYMCYNSVCSAHLVWDPISSSYETAQYVRKLQPDDTMIWKDGKRYKLVPVEGEK